MIDRIDDVVILGKIKLANTGTCYQIVDCDAVTLRIDLHNAISEYFDLTFTNGIVEGVNLTIGIADIDIVVVNQTDITNAGTCSGFCSPGTHAANADDTEMSPM
jgi:hypothetical protein